MCGRADRAIVKGKPQSLTRRQMGINSRDLGVIVNLAQYGKQAVCLRLQVVLGTNGKQARVTL